MKKHSALFLAGASLVVATAFPAHALTPCQTECNNRHLNTLQSMWQSSPPATTPMTDYRRQVLAALDSLNTCLAACGSAPAVPVNLAVGSSATASLTSSGYAPSRAVDGSTSTYWWAKSTSAQWIRVDLGAPAAISKVTLAWSGSNYATGYNIQVSANGSTWTTVYSTTAGRSGSAEHPFTATTARYVRVNCTKAAGKNGYAVTELGIIGN